MAIWLRNSGNLASRKTSKHHFLRFYSFLISFLHSTMFNSPSPSCKIGIFSIHDIGWYWFKMYPNNPRTYCFFLFTKEAFPESSRTSLVLRISIYCLIWLILTSFCSQYVESNQHWKYESVSCEKVWWFRETSLLLLWLNLTECATLLSKYITSQLIE